MPDFGLLQTPNFAQAAMAGIQAGREAGRQQRLDSALSGVDLSNPETIIPVLRADPSLGTGLLGASTKLAEAQREAASRQALGSYLLSTLPGAKGGGQASGVTQGGAVSPGSPADVPSGTEVVVQAPTVSPEALIRADPHAYLSVQENLGKLSDNHRKAVADAADAQGAVATAALQLPYAQRKAYIQGQAQYLGAHGVTAAEIDGFDPTDANLAAQRDQALGVKGILEQRDKQADNERADRGQASEIASRNYRDGLAGRADRRAGAARTEAHVRFGERALDRAAMVQGGVPHNTDDLDY